MTEKHSTDATIVNRKGLHARPAAAIARAANRFEAEVFISKNDTRVSARSIMGMMMLAASTGTALTLHAEGHDAAAALDAVADLISTGFGEDQGSDRDSTPPHAAEMTET